MSDEGVRCDVLCCVRMEVVHSDSRLGEVRLAPQGLDNTQRHSASSPIKLPKSSTVLGPLVLRYPQ